MFFVTAPALCGAALAIWLLDGRPVFFSQERLGIGRMPFRLRKFRTMRGGEVTKVGRVLRELGIDELPQLWNVLKGDMSLVGPRPLTQNDVERLGWGASRFDVRWSVRPGLTGPGQLRLRGRCHRRVTWLYDRTYVASSRAWIDVIRNDAMWLAASGVTMVSGRERARAWFRAQTKSRKRHMNRVEAL